MTEKPPPNKRHPWWRSFAYAAAGLRQLARTERNFRIHLLAAAAVIACGLWLRLDAVSWAILILTIAGVLAAEALNTAVEVVTDLASPGWHELARTAKDTAAAGVLVLSAAAVVVGLLILGPPLWQKLNHWRANFGM